jgi:aminoglycoside phosphotransferase family enzyme
VQPGRSAITDVPIAFLQNPEAWRALGVHGQRVTTVQTRRSWVFLCGDRVLKLKKPVRERVLDFSTPERREQACREEVRLNARLAPGVYLGVVALRRDRAGWRLDPRPDRRDSQGAPVDRADMRTPQSAPVPRVDVQAALTPPVDWLVWMRRLPASRMLDRLIADGAVGPPEARALADRLTPFWRGAAKVPLDAGGYQRGLRAEIAASLALLRQRRWALPGGTTRLRRLARALTARQPLLRQRAEAGRIVDGHGDLRPEHVYLPPRDGSGHPDADANVQVIDALEFNPRLRAVDPLDELAYFALECRRLGAPRFGLRVAVRCMQALGDRKAGAVLRLYTAQRALLRARLAVAHLLDTPVRDPERWRPMAVWYLAAAESALGLPG